jgi:hypothetical protein
MKKLFILIILSLFLIGCSDTPRQKQQQITIQHNLCAITYEDSSQQVSMYFDTNGYYTIEEDSTNKVIEIGTYKVYCPFLENNFIILNDNPRNQFCIEYGGYSYQCCILPKSIFVEGKMRDYCFTCNQIYFYL